MARGDTAREDTDEPRGLATTGLEQLNSRVVTVVCDTSPKNLAGTDRP